MCSESVIIYRTFLSVLVIENFLYRCGRGINTRQLTEPSHSRVFRKARPFAHGNSPPVFSLKDHVKKREKMTPILGFQQQQFIAVSLKRISSSAAREGPFTSSDSRVMNGVRPLKESVIPTVEVSHSYTPSRHPQASQYHRADFVKAECAGFILTRTIKESARRSSRTIGVSGSICFPVSLSGHVQSSAA